MPYSGSDSDPSAIFIRTLFDELYRVRNELGKGDHVTFVPYSHIVQSDEVHSIVKNDSKLMAITVVLMTVFSVSTLLSTVACVGGLQAGWSVSVF